MTVGAGIRMGVLVGPFNAALPDITTIATRAEALGFDGLYIPDHFNDIVSPIPALAAAAAVSGLTVGPYMLANDLRHPAITAREMASLDVLSGGRAVLGIGTGWMKIDYDAIGTTMDPFAVRAARLTDAIDTIRAVWSGAVHVGPHYTTSPGTTIRPVQNSGPPIMVGGGGPRMLALAARIADIVSIGVPLPKGDRRSIVEGVGSATFETLSERVSIATDHGATRLDMLLHRVAEDPTPVAGDFSVDPASLADNPYLLVGSAGIVAERLARLEEMGFESIVVRASDMEHAAAARAKVSR
ncbi:MAG: LLM class flavin-dependent oxidoreductase [Acidimicrobiia bacterium]|nr:LLM class flavin-dependent oxidoreductase [Acidimicrobiia bacterium]